MLILVIIMLETTANKPFKIVNASAGSGKTYHLVKEYIKLLISNDDKKQFSSIVAMTFTNKAAIEMKERIISALDKISSPNHFENEELELTEKIAKEIKCTISDIQKRCSLVLQNILHQYEDFNVMTIDKFNLRLIRSFGRELDLQHDFDVIMEEEEVIEKIVDDLLNQLGQEDSKELTKLLFNYSESNLEDGNSWNFRRNLIKFGKILTSEKNKEKVQELMQSDFSPEQRTALILRAKELDRQFLTEAEKIFELYNSGEVDESKIPGKSKTRGRIKTIVKSETFFMDVKSDKPFFSESFWGTVYKEEFPQKLSDACIQFHKYWENNVQEYASIKLFLKNFFNMALLQYMGKSLDVIKKEEQMILISEFNSLIHVLIQEENTPFIYERLGTRYHHFLLDEFQDTSHMQWLNLIPLIHESLGNGNENLIVGDAKQSIYRFKNGLAEQFIALPEIYNPEGIESVARKSDFFKDAGKVTELESNFRSSPTIVNFNNSFFETMKEKMSDLSASYYKSIHQNAAAKKNGLVHILSQEKETDLEETLAQIMQWIQACEDDGFLRGDICILGRNNRECNEWAVALTKSEKKYKVVSSDSLLIDSDLHVKLAIAYLKWRLKSGESEKRQFAELYFRWKHDNYDIYNQYIVEGIGKNDKKYRYFDEQTFLNQHFDSYTSFFFQYESIYDLIQGFFRIMQFNELENAYLHHLADIVYEYELKKGPNLRGFLDDYQRRKNKIAVQIPESSDAIKIMTIHKSKGLEFPVVILPNFNYKTDVKSSFLVNAEDLIVYKTPSKNELINVLSDLYSEEKNQVETDVTNLCYVALTRPQERLYIQNYFSKGTFGETFHSVLQEQEGVSINKETANSEDTECIELLLTDGIRTQPKEEKTTVALFEPRDIKEKLWFPDISLQDNPELYTEEYLSAEMQFGLQFHWLASKIESKDEVEIELEKAINEGEVEFSNKKELSKKLNELFSLDEYTELFKDKIKVLNEQAFLVDEKTSLRPDKIIIKEKETIVIDYKTGIPNAKDEKQVRGYCDLLDEMGYPDVKGVLFYSGLGELRRVG
ncbi:MAG TPA: hypothetical protein EYG86_00400 [Crocinitomicaceae bacterium]|nr:hypothetical protein [Crocinitomicaceae bacterium]